MHHHPHSDVTSDAFISDFNLYFGINCWLSALRGAFLVFCPVYQSCPCVPPELILACLSTMPLPATWNDPGLFIDQDSAFHLNWPWPVSWPCFLPGAWNDLLPCHCNNGIQDNMEISRIWGASEYCSEWRKLCFWFSPGFVIHKLGSGVQWLWKALGGEKPLPLSPGLTWI